MNFLKFYNFFSKIYKQDEEKENPLEQLKKKNLHVHSFSGLDEIIGQAIEHLKVRGEL